MPFHPSCLAPPIVFFLLFNLLLSPFTQCFRFLTCFFAASVRRRYPVSLFLPFTWHLCSPDTLFSLLAFIFASQSHASCAFFLALTSCLASFPSPRPASSHFQYSSINHIASDGKLGEGLGMRLLASCLHV